MSNLDKSRTELIPGHIPEMKEFPGKSRMDGHLTFYANAVGLFFWS